MPSPAKGIRLWLRPASDDAKATWIIRDGSKQVRTRCAAGDYQSAKRKLEEYQAEKGDYALHNTDGSTLLAPDLILSKMPLHDLGGSKHKPSPRTKAHFFSVE